MRAALDLVRAYPATTVTLTVVLIFLPNIIEIFTAVQRLLTRMQ